jgi:hypothetical protein
MTVQQIEAVLAARGVADAVPNVDYRLVDRLDGKGPVIEFWNEERLGPPPVSNLGGA